MSQVVYRANLSAKSFPFLSQNWGRTVIVPQYDNTFSRDLASSEDADRDIGIPQIFYCHNVMPHQQGFQSVGYTSVNAGTLILGGTARVAKDIFLVRDGAGNSIYLCYDTNGNMYKLVGETWIFLQDMLSSDITFAYVSGVTYIFSSKKGCWKYDFGTGLLVSVTLTGLSIVDILGITYSAGYLIAWTLSSVAWSSTIDPTDFTPSLVTGAGGGAVESARGTIVACVAHIQGFIVYTTANAVVAAFSGNTRFPFNFREIVASGGLTSLNNVTYDANTGNHYAYTTSGLQLISTTQTQTILPEATDFISGKLFEDYDESTDTFYSTPLSATMMKRVAMISDRYLVISYGMFSLTHALVYDLTDKRWGKLRIEHVACFEYQLYSPVLIEIPRQSIAFLGKDGTIQVVDFSVNSISSNGVICLGKYQFIRQRLLQLDEIECENFIIGYNPTVLVLSALDGKNTTKSVPVPLANNNLYRRYGCSAVGKNHSLVFRGAFSLVSLVLTFHIHGKN